MPTVGGGTIGTGGTYTTIALWEAAAPADLRAGTGTDQIWQGKCLNQTFGGTTANVVTLAGTTGDATHYIELTADTGASFADNANAQTNALRANSANGAYISGSGQYASSAPIIVNEEYVRINRLQIAQTGANNRALDAQQSATSTWHFDINQCIIEGTGPDAARVYGSNTTIRNSLIVQRGSGRAAILGLSNSAQAINCTIVCPTGITTKPTAAVAGTYGTPLLKNCAIFGASALTSGSSTFSYTTCATDLTGTTGITGSVAYSTSTFANVADSTRDFRLVTGSALIDVGTTDSTNAANDIVGTARPSGTAYDIGAWEFVAAGGGTTVSVPLATLTLAGQVPTVATTANQTVAVPAGALTLSALAPTVVTGANQVVAVPTGSLTLAAQVPTVTATANQTVAVPAASLTLTGQAPTVSVSVSVAVPLGTLSLTGFAPAVATTQNVLVDVPAATMSLTGYAPTVSGVVVQNATVSPLGGGYDFLDPRYHKRKREELEEALERLPEPQRKVARQVVDDPEPKERLLAEYVERDWPFTEAVASLLNKILEYRAMTEPTAPQAPEPIADTAAEQAAEQERVRRVRRRRAALLLLLH